MSAAATAVVLGASVSAGLFAATIVWRSLRRVREPGRRLAARLALCPLLFLAIGRACAPIAASGLDMGTWRCVRCGASRDETRWNDLRLSVEPASEAVDSTAERARFGRWYAMRFGPECEHSWEPTGCHGVGPSTVRCSPEHHAYFRLLPLFEDRELARSLHERVVLESWLERRRTFDLFERGLWDAVEAAGGLAFGSESEMAVARRIEEEIVASGSDPADPSGRR